MEMRLARREDIPALSLLWQECFGDEAAYIDAFYSHRFDAIHVVVAVDDKENIIGMIHMLPCDMACDDLSESINDFGTNAYYLYAVGVTRSWRGCGAMRTMMTTIVDECKKKSIALTLSPINEKLIPYYESYGFCMEGGYYHGFFERSELGHEKDLDWLVCDSTEYFMVQASCLILSVRPRIAFLMDGIDYALRENAYFGGCALYSSKGDCALVQQEGAHLVVREFCSMEEDASSVRAHLGALLDFFGAKSCEIRTPIDFLPELQKKEALMANLPMVFKGQSFGYSNLLLD